LSPVNQEALADILVRKGLGLPGVQLRISFGPPHGGVPRSGTPGGATITQAIVDAIADHSAAVHRMTVGHFLVYQLDFPHIVNIAYFRSGDPTQPSSLQVGDGYTLSADDAVRLLARAVERKMTKRYPSFVGRKMLLVYTLRCSSAGVDLREVSVARAVLRSSHGQFDEVWHCWPMPEGTVSPINQIWPEA
jgi:hypothetical protein